MDVAQAAWAAELAWIASEPAAQIPPQPLTLPYAPPSPCAYVPGLELGKNIHSSVLTTDKVCYILNGAARKADSNSEYYCQPLLLLGKPARTLNLAQTEVAGCASKHPP